MSCPERGRAVSLRLRSSRATRLPRPRWLQAPRRSHAGRSRRPLAASPRSAAHRHTLLPRHPRQSLERELCSTSPTRALATDTLAMSAPARHMSAATTCSRGPNSAVRAAASTSKSGDPHTVGFGGQPRRWTSASLHRAVNGARALHVARGLAPPWTRSTSGPSPSRITTIALITAAAATHTGSEDER